MNHTCNSRGYVSTIPVFDYMRSESARNRDRFSFGGYQNVFSGIRGQTNIFGLIVYIALSSEIRNNSFCICEVSVT